MTEHFVVPGNPGETGHASMMMRVQAIRWRAPDIREIEFCLPVPGGTLPGIEPGGHVDIELPGDLVRSYSLTNGPDRRDAYCVAVRRAPDSQGGSAYMCDSLRVGELLRVTPARNTFPLAADAAESIFIAGGIGITPILSMIRHREASGASWRLIYAARSRADAAYLPELEALDGDRGRVQYHFDDENGDAHLDLASCVAQAPADAHLYACGPAPMLDAYEAACADLPPDCVHLERFAGDADLSGGGFTVELRRSGKEFFIPEGRTIMEVLHEAGIRVAYSCQSGVCGTCETRVLEGQPDHRDQLLSESEKARGRTMMICCSRALSDRLVLDI